MSPGFDYFEARTPWFDFFFGVTDAPPEPDAPFNASPFQEHPLQDENRAEAPSWMSKTALPAPSEGGMASHFRAMASASLPIHVSPTASDEFNTVALPLRAIACWRIDDPRFDFDSSFIKPSAASEFTRLAALWHRVPRRVASVFGHADPVGNDDYNKTLSGRRAIAVYGVMTRDAALWEDLYNKPLGGDHWGPKMIQAMLGPCGFDPGPIDGLVGGKTIAAIKAFQKASGLPLTGFADAATRRALFTAYMDAICRDEAGEPFVLARTDFLGRGEDPGGKADFQSCGEFNPIMVFSKEEQARFASGRATERNAENAPNRRVIIYLFDEAVKISPERWPCPRAREGTAACKAQFWGDADARRSPGAERREYARTEDTFACSFYDRLARRSPCEAVPAQLTITLFDQALRLMPGARYRIWLTGTPLASPPDRQGAASADSKVIEPNVLAAGRCLIEWAPASFDPGAIHFPFRAVLHVGFSDAADEVVEAQKRLHNMGYSKLASTLEGQIGLFQDDYRVPVAPEARGQLDEATKTALRNAHDQGLPRPIREGDN